MARIIAISTNKGGVLKTTVTTNLAALFSKKGKVLIVDMDTQGNSSLSFGENPDLYKISIYDVLMGYEPYQKAIYSIHENIDIIPANIDMETFEIDVLTNLKKYPSVFNLLSDNLKGVEEYYDYILIDSPPNLGIVQGNILCYAEEVLIPFQPEKYSMRSLLSVLRTINDFQETRNPKLKITGIIPTLVDSRTVLHSLVLEECRKYCFKQGINVFDTVIPKSIRYANSVAYYGGPYMLKYADSDENEPYIQLEKEIIEAIKI